MQGRFEPRSFTPISIPGLSNKARQAVDAALDAMSTWRNETADASEKNSKQVVEKLAEAAKALGWPEQVVDTVRAQMQSVADIQIKTMDQIMDVWEEQLKLPDPANASTSAMLSKLKLPLGLGSAGPGIGNLQLMNPMQVWLEFLQQSQKSWADAMAAWSIAGKPR
jgi:hypothetical protein